MKRALLASVAVVAIGGSAISSDSVTLIRGGQPVSTIVTADHPTAAARQGATDLQMWLRRSSGAIVPIRAESALKPYRDGALILVGETRRSRSLGLVPDTLGLEEIVVRTFPHTLVLIGDDARPDGYALAGSQWAVDVFAEKVLGIRLLWPGPLGEIVPPHTTIEVDDLDLREQPRLVDRRMEHLGYNGVILPKLDALGWDRDAYRQFQKRARVWYRFHRFGGSYTGNFGHAFGRYWDRYHAQHPDWFALQPDGTRDNGQPEHALYESHRLCISNPELIAQVARDSIEALKKNPQLDAVSVSPNDGGQQTFCLCDRCEAWDAPDAEMITMRSKQGPISHVGLSDRFVRFYSAVAEIVAKELPDRYIGAYAYSLYKRAPLHARLHPNVVIGFVPGSKVYQNDAEREELLADWLRWSQCAEKLFLRPNFLMALHALPTVYVHRMGEDMRFYADHKMLFAHFDCNFHHWATNGLNYYVLAKLLWDPYRDVDQLIAEYCQAGFGPAAEPVRRYFDELERITTAIAAERARPSPAAIARHYSDQTLADLRAILDEASRRAGEDTLVQQRVMFLRKGLEYAPICRDYRVAKAAGRRGDKWQWRAFLEQSVRRTTWFQGLGPSRVIHAPWLIYWDW